MAVRDYNNLVERLRIIGVMPNVELEQIGEFEQDGRVLPLFVLYMGAFDPGKMRVMIASGIHGDEPAGVEAALEFVEKNANNSQMLSLFHFTIYPCNNPTGWELNTRENANGIDLNREFNAYKPAPEVVIIQRSLQGKCFDLVFEMHEDIDSPGFYMYEITEDADRHVGEAIVEAVEAAGYPVNCKNEIEGMPARGGVIRRNSRIQHFRKTRIPQAIYAYRTCGGHVITLEPPASILPLEDRVKIELMALDIALESSRRCSLASAQEDE